MSPHRLGVAVRVLDDLRSSVEKLACASRWSALAWRVACSPLLLQLPQVRRSLADLGEIRVGQWPDTDWAMRLCAARSEVERRLIDVKVSMSALVSQEVISADSVVTFSSDAALLAKAAGEFCGLIVGHYPAVTSES